MPLLEENHLSALLLLSGTTELHLTFHLKIQSSNPDDAKISHALKDGGVAPLSLSSPSTKSNWVGGYASLQICHTTSHCLSIACHRKDVMEEAHLTLPGW